MSNCCFCNDNAEFEKWLDESINSLIKRDDEIQAECKRIICDLHPELKGIYKSFWGFTTCSYTRKWESYDIENYIQEFGNDFPVDSFILSDDKKLLILLSKTNAAFSIETRLI